LAKNTGRKITAFDENHGFRDLSVSVSIYCTYPSVLSKYVHIQSAQCQPVAESEALEYSSACFCLFKGFATPWMWQRWNSS